jgi:hypothetical protein
MKKVLSLVAALMVAMSVSAYAVWFGPAPITNKGKVEEIERIMIEADKQAKKIEALINKFLKRVQNY